MNELRFFKEMSSIDASIAAALFQVQYLKTLPNHVDL